MSLATELSPSLAGHRRAWAPTLASGVSVSFRHSRLLTSHVPGLDVPFRCTVKPSRSPRPKSQTRSSWSVDALTPCRARPGVRYLLVIRSGLSEPLSQTAD